MGTLTEGLLYKYVNITISGASLQLLRFYCGCLKVKLALQSGFAIEPKSLGFLLQETCKNSLRLLDVENEYILTEL